jgi:hypothetical protein
MPNHVQNLLTINGALRMALEKCLHELVNLYGNQARPEIERLRDELVRKFMNAGVPAERDLDHVIDRARGY